MTYTVDLDSSIDAAIAERANRRGVTVSEYLRQLAEEDVLQNDSTITFGEQWVAEFGDRPAGTGTGKWSEVEASSAS